MIIKDKYKESQLQKKTTFLVVFFLYKLFFCSDLACNFLSK